MIIVLIILGAAIAAIGLTILGYGIRDNDFGKELSIGLFIPAIFSIVLGVFV